MSRKLVLASLCYLLFSVSTCSCFASDLTASMVVNPWLEIINTQLISGQGQIAICEGNTDVLLHFSRSQFSAGIIEIQVVDLETGNLKMQITIDCKELDTWELTVPSGRTLIQATSDRPLSLNVYPVSIMPPDLAL